MSFKFHLLELLGIPKKRVREMANIYDEYFIVDEKLASDFIQSSSCSAGCFSQFILRTAGSELELKVVNESGRLQIKDVASPHSTNASGPLADIVVWKWQEATQTMEHCTKLDSGGGSVDLEFLAVSIVIRILEKRQVLENPCPPLMPNDGLTVHIGKRQVTVSGSWLMSVSPVFEGMLSANMTEQRERTLILDNPKLDFTMDEFELFLLYTSRKYWRRILPNPTTVLDLLHLADYFQVDWLRERCDIHLVNCAEIPLLQRFLLVDRYRLAKMKDFFLRSLSIVRLKEFMQANRGELSPSIGREFSFELSMRLSESE